MKTLSKNEWIAVIVSVFVVGFFFIFGQTLMSLFIHNPSSEMNTQQPQLTAEDTIVGTGDVAVSGSRITVNYVGHFIDGTVFDSSVSRNEPFQFVLGAGQVIQGWDKGIAGMRVGGKRILTIPPEMGYGSKDYGPIKGNSTLVFEVELLKVEK
jgi:FKBP-type peptidyl-prolyl cis-trans isomerase